MRIKSKASKLISVLLVAVMIVTTVSVSFAETEQISDVTTPAAQEVDVLSASDDSSAKASDANQASDVQASDVQASGTQESGTDATDSTEAADSNVTSTEGETEEDVILSSESDEEAVEEGIALLAEQGYTIKFNRNGGSGTAPADITTDEDGNFTFPGKGSMSRSGYTFMGWGRSTTTGHCDTSDGSIPKNATNYSIYEPGEKGSASRDMKYYAVWARSESAQYFIRLDGTVPREPGDYSTSLYTDQIGTGKTVALNTFYANSNIADNGVASHLGNTPTTAEIMNACNAKASSIIFSDGSRYERCSTTGDFEKKYYVIWYVVKLAGTIHVDGSLLKKSLYNVTYEPNAKAGEYTGTVPATKQYAAGQKVTVEKSNLQREGYTFVGWESSIDGKTYNAGSKFTMPENNVVLKAIWVREGNLSYTVNYLDQSTGDAIADPKVVGDKHYGDEVTETAIDIDGYDKVEPVSETITISKGENVINFYYTKRTDLSYTVKYMEKDTTNEIAKAKTVNGQTFGASVSESAIEIPGYKAVAPTTADITITTGTNVHIFYYQKRTDLSYTVNYLEQGTNKVLSDARTVNGQTFGTSVSESAIEIPGYDVVGSSSQTVEITAGSNEITFYYTKKNNLTYVVRYLEKDTNAVLKSAVTVGNKTFQETVTETAPDINGYTKLDPTSVTLTISADNSENEIIFYYQKRTDLAYTVNYLEQRTNKVLSTAKTVNGQTFGASVTENAIDIEGYNKVTPVTETITIGTSANVINFYYTKRTDLSYTVKYMEKDTTNEIATAKTVNGQTFGASVTENAIDIAGYNKVGDTTKTITIAVEGNVIIFYYEKRTDLSYTVNYLEKGTNQVLAPADKVDNQTFGASVTREAIDIAGYNKVAPTTKTITIAVEGNIINFYYEKRTDLSYKVRYLEAETEKALADDKGVERQTFGASVEEAAISIDGYNVVGESTKTLRISANIKSNVITFYYVKRNDLAYVVNYLDKDTKAPVADTKTVADQTFNASVTETAIDIDGYNKVAPVSATINISTDNSKNVINFYYEKRTDLSYTINYYKDSVSENNKLGSTETVGNQIFKSVVSLDSETINARKPNSDYYDGQVSPEKLTIAVSGNNFNVVYVKKPEMSIEAAGYEGKYDGAAHSGTVTSSAVKGETVYTYYQIIGDETKKLDSAPSVTDVQRDAEGNVITLHYMVEASNDEYSAPEPAYFDIKITPLQISIFWARNIDYDGLVHTFEIGTSKDQTEDGVLEGETLYHNATISGQAAGTYDKVSDYSWCVYKSDEKTDSTVNYDIEIVALLTISKARPDTKLSLDIDSYKGVYDGQEHERLAIFQAPAGIAASTEIQYSRDGKNWTTDVPSIKNVGKETCYVRAYNESFIDDEYPMKEYTLEVTPRNLIIYAEAEYMYDGEEKVLHITADDMADMDTGNEGLVDGEFLSLENALIKGTEPGVYTKVSEYSAEVFKMYSKPADDEAALMVDADAAEVEVTTENYNIQVAGKLTITSLAANDPAGKNAKGDSDKGSGNGTKTGDTTPVGILFGLLALAACGGGFAAFGRRKREE